MKGWLKILGGLLLILVAVFIAVTFTSWGVAALALLKGGVVWLIGLIGAILLLVGLFDMKE